MFKTAYLVRGVREDYESDELYTEVQYISVGVVRSAGQHETAHVTELQGHSFTVHNCLRGGLGWLPW